MEISAYWWAFAVIFVLFSLWLLLRNIFNEQSVMQEPVRKPLNNDNEVLPNHLNIPATSIENRKLSDSKGYIPMENLVISEIPIAKAEEIGHFEVKRDEQEKKNGE